MKYLELPDEVSLPGQLGAKRKAEFNKVTFTGREVNITLIIHSFLNNEGEYGKAYEEISKDKTLSEDQKRMLAQKYGPKTANLRLTNQFVDSKGKICGKKDKGATPIQTYIKGWFNRGDIELKALDLGVHLITANPAVFTY